MRLKAKPTVAILCRVSTHGQLDGVSLDVQEQRGRAYIKRLGGVEGPIYRGQESGLSEMEDRNLLRQALDGARAGRFQHLYTLDRSRLARNPKTAMLVWAAFKNLGIQWHTDAGPTDLDTPEGRLISGVMAFVEEYMATKPRTRTGQSRKTLLEKGEHAFGRWPWGRRWNKATKSWTVDREAKRQIERAYDLYVKKSHSMESAAAAVGMPKSSLRKRFVSAGVTEWERVFDGNHYVLKIPALLTKQQAAAIQRRARTNATVLPDNNRERWLLQGVIRCSICGGALSGTPSTKNGGKPYPIYRHAVKLRKVDCLWGVPAPLIERDVVAACGELIRQHGKLKTAIRAALDKAANGRAELERDAKRLAAEIRTAKGKISNAADALLQFKHSGAGRQALIVRLKAQEHALHDLEEEQAKVVSELAAQELSDLDAGRIAKQLASLCGLNGNAPLVSLTKAQQRLLVTTVVGRTRRDSAEGIYVRQVRFGGKKDVYWEWELRGAFGVLQSTSSTFEHFDRGVIVKKLQIADTATALRLASIASEARRVGLRSVPLSSSDGSHRCG